MLRGRKDILGSGTAEPGLRYGSKAGSQEWGMGLRWLEWAGNSRLLPADWSGVHVLWWMLGKAWKPWSEGGDSRELCTLEAVQGRGD